MRTVCRPPPLMNVPRAWSTSAATSEGSGATDSVPVSMRPASSRSPDQAVHAVGLLVNDAEELRHLGRALDRGQRRAQLVAHHAQELGPHALDFLQRRQVLQGDHDRGERVVRAVRVADRGGVDERRDAAPVRDREHDLLEQLLGGLAGAAQVLHDACGLAVERDQGAGPRLEHHDADR